MANRETCLKYLVVSDCTPQFRQRAFALLPDLDLHVYASDDPVPSLLANVNGQAELQPVPVQPDVSARQHYIEAEHTHRRLFSLVHKMVGGGPEAQRDAAVEMMRRATEQSAARSSSSNEVGGGGVVDVTDSSVSGGLEEEEEGEPVLFDAEDDDAASRMVMEDVSVDPWVRGRAARRVVECCRWAVVRGLIKRLAAARAQKSLNLGATPRREIFRRTACVASHH